MPSRPVPARVLAPAPAPMRYAARDFFPEEAIYGKIARRGVKNFERRATSGWVQQVIASDVWLSNARSLRRSPTTSPSRREILQFTAFRRCDTICRASTVKPEKNQRPRRILGIPEKRNTCNPRFNECCIDRRGNFAAVTVKYLQ